MPAKSQRTFVEKISPASGTAFTYTPSTVTSTSTGEIEAITGLRIASLKPRLSERVIAQAVLNYLRFQRARGKTVVLADEVAAALSLSVHEVERIAAELASHGVKLEV